MFPITFVSLGPGEAELITLKGLKALQAADCIFCPETPARDGRPLSRAADIMLRLDIPAGHIRRFSLPMSKQRTDALNAYDRVYAEALSLHHAGRKVAVVAEGDAGFYSSIHYIYEKLQAAGIPVEQIAGIPAFIAAGARGGLHIASQEERLTVIPRHHHRRRDRAADTVGEHSRHHEAVAMRRRGTPLHPPASRIRLPLF